MYNAHVWSDLGDYLLGTKRSFSHCKPGESVLKSEVKNELNGRYIYCISCSRSLDGKILHVENIKTKKEKLYVNHMGRSGIKEP